VSDDFHHLAILQKVEELVQGQFSLLRKGGREGMAWHGGSGREA